MAVLAISGTSWVREEYVQRVSYLPILYERTRFLWPCHFIRAITSHPGREFHLAGGLVPCRYRRGFLRFVVS